MSHSTRLLFAASLVLAAYALPAEAAAATLRTSPASGTYTLGQTISVVIGAESAEQAMNAVSGTLLFPVNLLEAVSVSKSGSIIGIWAEEPAISNRDGTVRFEGVALNPGYQGPFGKVLTATFKVKAAGTAELKFISGSILANDGVGTNILSGSSGSAFALAAGTSAVPPPKAEPAPGPAVDRTPPEPFTVTRIGGTPEESRPLLAFTARDTGSGIAQYEIAIDGGAWFAAKPLEETPGRYRLPRQAPGVHRVVVRAHDRSGNTTDASIELTIQAIPAPVFKKYSPRIAPPQHPFAAEGTALPSTTVYIAIRKGESTFLQTAVANAEGSWNAIYDGRLEPGAYTVSAHAEDASGATSFETDPLPVTVESWLKTTGLTLGEYGAAAAIALFIIFLLVAGSFLGHTHLMLFRRRLKARVASLEGGLRKDVTRLETDLRKGRISREQLLVDADTLERDAAESLDRLKKME